MEKDCVKNKSAWLQGWSWAARYVFAIVAVAVAFGCWCAIKARIGPGLPPFITFYPTVMLVALLAGFGPGLLATLLSAGAVAYWIIPPAWYLSIDRPVDRLALALFGGMGVLMSVVAELYRRNRDKAAAYDKEVKLRESEAQYKALFENMQEGFAHCQMIFDGGGRPVDFIYLNVNSAFGRLTGLENVVGKRVTEVLPGIRSQHPELFETYGHVASTGQPERFEIDFKPLSKWLDVSVYSPQRGYFVAMFDDITERKQAEDALTKISTLLSESQKIAHCGSFEYVVETQTTVWSEEEFRIYGLDPAGPSPEYQVMLAKYIHPDDAPRLHETFSAAMESASVYELEHRIVRPDGSVRVVYDRAHPHLDANGKLLRYVGATLDITERKSTETRLRDSEERLSLALEAAGAGTWDWDISTNRLNWSPRLFALFGIDPAKTEASFDAWRKVVHPQDVKVAEENIEFTVKNRTLLKNEYRIILPDGEVRWILALGSCAYNPEGQAQRMSGICIDITERKQTQEASIALANAKSKFTSTVSHELRSPLAAIQEATNLVLDGSLGPVNDDQKDVLGTAKDNIDRLGRLINNVLAYQKMEAGEIGLALNEHDINEVVREVHKSTMLLARDRRQDLVMQLGTNLAKVKFDKDGIFQVLTNLLANAVKYSEGGTIIIQTQLENSELHVSVRDCGLGIKKEYLGKIFKPFSQVGDNRKSGTGLGLAIAKEIVLAHHGRIWAESEVGKGSVFHFTLPI